MYSIFRRTVSWLSLTKRPSAHDGTPKFEATDTTPSSKTDRSTHVVRGSREIEHTPVPHHREVLTVKPRVIRTKRIRRAQAHNIHRQHSLARTGIAITKLRKRLSPAKGAELSALERLPQEILKHILDGVEDGASLICLALTSKSMLASSHPFSWDKFGIGWDWYSIQFPESPPGDELSPRRVRTPYCIRPMAHLCLMYQLRSWMPPRLQFCWHCLHWLPRFFFPGKNYCKLYEAPQFLCFDCVPGHLYAHKRWESCDGCSVSTEVAFGTGEVCDGEEDEEQEEEAEEDMQERLEEGRNEWEWLANWAGDGWLMSEDDPMLPEDANDLLVQKMKH